jgi:hypothetical protein
VTFLMGCFRVRCRWWARIVGSLTRRRNLRCTRDRNHVSCPTSPTARCGGFVQGVGACAVWGVTRFIRLVFTDPVTLLVSKGHRVDRPASR